MRAADHYAIAEGSGADTSQATADLREELDAFEQAVRDAQATKDLGRSA